MDTGAYFPLTDKNGSVRDVLDSTPNDAPVDVITYDAYGNIVTQTSSNGSETNPSQYLGQYSYDGYDYDAADNLYLVHARVYDPQSQRWLSQDPMGFDAGDSNLYRYVNNSPVNGVDPSGNELFALSFNAASRARQSLDSYGIKTAIYQLPASRGAEGTSPDLYRPIPNLPADAQKGYLYYLTPTNGLPGTAPNFETDGYAKNLYNGLKSYTFHTLTYATGGVPQKFWRSQIGTIKSFSEPITNFMHSTG